MRVIFAATKIIKIPGDIYFDIHLISPPMINDCVALLSIIRPPARQTKYITLRATTTTDFIIYLSLNVTIW